MGVQDRPIIEKFRHDMLGRLYQYDDLHGTDLVTFLRIYLEENGSTNKVSELQFIHRNTVLYKVNKISMILDIDLSNAYTKTNLLLAFLIEDVLKRVH